MNQKSNSGFVDILNKRFFKELLKGFLFLCAFLMLSSTSWAYAPTPHNAGGIVILLEDENISFSEETVKISIGHSAGRGLYGGANILYSGYVTNNEIEKNVTFAIPSQQSGRPFIHIDDVLIPEKKTNICSKD